jgi:hypothetical protein
MIISSEESLNVNYDAERLEGDGTARKHVISRYSRERCSPAATTGMRDAGGCTVQDANELC